MNISLPSTARFLSVTVFNSRRSSPLQQDKTLRVGVDDTGINYCGLKQRNCHKCPFNVNANNDDTLGCTTLSLPQIYAIINSYRQKYNKGLS